MTSIFTLHLLAVVIAAPGMFILALASLSLLGWSYRQGFPLARFEPTLTDEGRLIRTSLDLTYGLIPVATSWFIEGFSLTSAAVVSSTVFWVIFGAMLAYPFLYYRFIRPTLTSLRLAIRNRVPLGKQGS